MLLFLYQINADSKNYVCYLLLMSNICAIYCWRATLLLFTADSKMPCELPAGSNRPICQIDKLLAIEWFVMLISTTDVLLLSTAECWVIANNNCYLNLKWSQSQWTNRVLVEFRDHRVEWFSTAMHTSCI